uniref:Uncharacterized protein n=1 Tax=Nelumbo nucifera TaxID=4432 RepID=A0A822XF15_NELNU|nr:TPA_asm: hypothetical protein HUJ06_020250 [Nelumbo nucifera]
MVKSGLRDMCSGSRNVNDWYVDLQNLYLSTRTHQLPDVLFLSLSLSPPLSQLALTDSGF